MLTGTCTWIYPTPYPERREFHQHCDNHNLEWFTLFTEIEIHFQTWEQLVKHYAAATETSEVRTDTNLGFSSIYLLNCIPSPRTPLSRASLQSRSRSDIFCSSSRAKDKHQKTSPCIKELRFDLQQVQIYQFFEASTSLWDPNGLHFHGWWWPIRRGTTPRRDSDVI